MIIIRYAEETMLYDFAPMEGVTGYLFRRTHAECFSSVDRYWAPFLAPDGKGRCKAGAWRDLLPENNPDALPVPQILCNAAEPFLHVARELAAMGYEEVNLNAGCPSATVVPKHKGAGLLLDLDTLDKLLADVFSLCPLKVSVKTRLGVESAAEFPAVLEIYRRYPLSELVIHARDRTGMYHSAPDLTAFAEAAKVCSFPVRYNGSICGESSLAAVTSVFPGLERVMIGRAAAADPALFRRLRGGEKLRRDELKDFLERYAAALADSGLGEHYALGRLKELWYYVAALFPGEEKALKRLFKSHSLPDYRSAVTFLFSRGGFDASAKFSEQNTK